MNKQNIKLVIARNEAISTKANRICKVDSRV